MDIDGDDDLELSTGAALAAPPDDDDDADDDDDDDDDADDADDADGDDGDDDDEGDKGKAGAEEELREMQQLIQRVESQRMDLAGCDVNDPATFWVKAYKLEEAQSKGRPTDGSLRELGFQNGKHFDTVRDYITAKWSFLAHEEDGHYRVRQRDEYTNALTKGRIEQMRQSMEAAAAAIPGLLDPVAGVSLDQYATAAVAVTRLPQNATPADVERALATIGLDRARWDAANTGWMQKMQTDTTGMIGAKYGEAFARAQGLGPGSPEPCTFERWCEIGAAQSAWSQQGKDVNAHLRSVFGIGAADWSMFSSYWTPKMATDVRLGHKYGELSEKYAQKYAGADPDDDLSV